MYTLAVCSQGAPARGKPPRPPRSIAARLKDIRDSAMERHKGTQIHLWLDDADLARLDELAAMSIRGTRSDAIRMLINSRTFHDRSYRDAISLLGKIGGLMKKTRTGTREQAQEVVKIARELRTALHDDNTDA